jgi:hypothetical protein
MMATPVRAYIDQGLKASIGTISDLIHAGTTVPSIFMNPSLAIQDQEPKPYAMIWTSDEKSNKANEYVEKSFIAEVSIWADADNNDDLYAKLIDYAAQINQALIPGTSLIRLVSGFIEIEENPGLAMDTLFYETGKGLVYAQYSIKYRHVYGNPYIANPI